MVRNQKQKVSTRKSLHLHSKMQSLYRPADLWRILKRLAVECSKDGWDGGDAAPITPEVVDSVYNFIQALPKGIAMPDIAPEPDGSISLDWIQTGPRIVSVSIGPFRIISYAWLNESGSGYGTFYFSSSVPKQVLKKLKEGEIRVKLVSRNRLTEKPKDAVRIY